MSFIEARYHGGGCCGMSHISGFPATGPDTICEAIERKTDVERRQLFNEYYGIPFNYTRPRETAKERLVAVVNALSVQTDPTFGWSRRVSGILEVVLIASQKTVWGDTLKELGFKEINSHLNSNSGRTIHVFHKNTGN